MDPSQVNSRGAYAPHVGRSALEVPRPDADVPQTPPPTSPLPTSESSQPRRDRLRRIVATAMFAGMLLLALLRPDASPVVMGLLGSFGLALFGIDVPWSRIPWGLLLGRGGE